MFDHELNPIKGWPSPYALDKSLPVADGEADIFAGMAMYVEAASGKFKQGVVDGAMTVFAFQGQDDFDANSDVGNISGGAMSGLVATGAYELETTEFANDTYAPNDPLTGTSAADGELKKGVTYTDQILGIVSDGQSTNENGKSVLRFWPVFIPPTP